VSTSLTRLTRLVRPLAGLVASAMLLAPLVGAGPADAGRAAAPPSIAYLDSAGIHTRGKVLPEQAPGRPIDLVDLGGDRFAVLTAKGKTGKAVIVSAEETVFFSDAVSLAGSGDGRRFAYVRRVGSTDAWRLVVRQTSGYYDRVVKPVRVPGASPSEGRVEVLGFRDGRVWLSQTAWRSGERWDWTRTFDLGSHRFTTVSRTRATESMSTVADQVALIRQEGGCTGYDVVRVPRGRGGWRLCDEQRGSNQLVWSPDGSLLLHPLYDEGAAQYTKVELRQSRSGDVRATIPVGRLLRLGWEDQTTFLEVADDAEAHGGAPTTAWVDRCGTNGLCERVLDLTPTQARHWLPARPRG
jgi:hypothetical protein